MRGALTAAPSKDDPVIKMPLRRSVRCFQKIVWSHLVPSSTTHGEADSKAAAQEAPSKGGDLCKHSHGSCAKKRNRKERTERTTNQSAIWVRLDAGSESNALEHEK